MPKMTRSPLGRTRSFQGKWMRTVSPRVGAKSRQCFGLKSTQTESPAFGAPSGRSVPPLTVQLHRVRGPSGSDARIRTSSVPRAPPPAGPPRAKLSCWARSFWRHRCRWPARPAPLAFCGPQLTSCAGREEASSDAEASRRRSAPGPSPTPGAAPARAPAAWRTRSARPPPLSVSRAASSSSTGSSARALGTPRPRTSPARPRALATPCWPPPSLMPQASRGGSGSCPPARARQHRSCQPPPVGGGGRGLVGSGVERGTPHRLRTARPGRGRRGRVPRRRERGSLCGGGGGRDLLAPPRTLALARGQASQLPRAEARHLSLPPLPPPAPPGLRLLRGRRRRSMGGDPEALVGEAALEQLAARAGLAGGAGALDAEARALVEEVGAPYPPPPPPLPHPPTPAPPSACPPPFPGRSGPENARSRAGGGRAKVVDDARG